MSEITENEEKLLLLGVATGSERSFSQLFHLYRDKLYSFVFRLSGSKELAEDAVQDVFLKIWQRREEVASINQFDAYLFRMARNHILNAFRRINTETSVLNELADHDLSTDEVSAGFEYKEMESAVREAIGKLPNKQKQVFILSREYGLKQAEISNLLKITVPTVKSHITQAMHSIRKECKNIHSIINVVLLLSSFFY